MQPEQSTPAGNADNQPTGLRPLLQKTSRTFALSIPLLPEPLQTEVAVAYLLFRIIDTFEDATRWEPARRVKALELFVQMLNQGDPQDYRELAARWVDDPPVHHPGYLELLAATPDVVQWHRQLRPAASEQLWRHLTRSARGMAQVVQRTDGTGLLQLQTLQDLRDYCFVVAGIVGEMLTELFLLQTPSLQVVAGDLRARAVEFGEGLQLINILKDSQTDGAERRSYLPRAASLAEVFSLARADLRRGVEYTELTRTAGAAAGLVAFNALNLRLAIATLHLLRDQGPGAKLSRVQVTSMAVQVMNAIDTGGVLFPERP
jgi:farnesyl-diphosphate farnesyltransferase